MFKKVLKGLKAVAPIAAKVGAVTGVIPPGTLQALGLSPGASDEDIELAAVKADPSQLAALRKVEADLQVSMAEIGLKEAEVEVKEEAIHAGDRDSARKREMEVKDSTPKILAFSTLGAVCGLAAALVFRDIPQTSAPVLNTLLGALTAMLISVGTYYFGSSSGSQKKDAALHAVATERAKK